VGRNSVISIAIWCGLDGPGIESQGRRDFQHPSVPALRSIQPPVHWIPGLSWGRGDDHLPHLAPRWKKEYSNTTTPPPRLRGPLQSEIYFEFSKSTILCHCFIHEILRTYIVFFSGQCNITFWVKLFASDVVLPISNVWPTHSQWILDRRKYPILPKRPPPPQKKKVGRCPP
jgi:hypothetical protein